MSLTVGFCDIPWVLCRKEGGYQGRLSELVTSLSSAESAPAPSLDLLCFNSPLKRHLSIDRRQQFYSDLYMDTRLRNDPSLGKVFSGWQTLEVFGLRTARRPKFHQLLWHDQ